MRLCWLWRGRLDSLWLLLGTIALACFLMFLLLKRLIMLQGCFVLLRLPYKLSYCWLWISKCRWGLRGWTKLSNLICLYHLIYLRLMTIMILYWGSLFFQGNPAILLRLSSLLLALCYSSCLLYSSCFYPIIVWSFEYIERWYKILICHSYLWNRLFLMYL